MFSEFVWMFYVIALGLIRYFGLPLISDRLDGASFLRISFCSMAF